MSGSVMAPESEVRTVQQIAVLEGFVSRGERCRSWALFLHYAQTHEQTECYLRLQFDL